MKTVDPAVYENSCQYRYHQGTAPSIIQMRALFRPWHSVLQFPIRSDGQSTEGIVTMSTIQLPALKRTADRHCEIDYFTVIISLANYLLECQWPVWEIFIGSYWITHVAKITATAKR